MQKILHLFFISMLVARVAAQTCSGSVGDNIFPDGDFGKGVANILSVDPGLAPGYRYQFNPPPNDGFYCITNNTTTWGSFAAIDWINIGDNSGDPTGYMMVVNASVAPGLFYEKTVPVCGNTNYEFSADVIAMNDPSRGSGFIPPNISFLINGEVKFSSGNVPIDARWHTYGFTFTTDSAATEIKLALRNNAPGGFGNDLALDNISFRPCGPNVVLIDTASFCTTNREITINAEVIGSAFATPVFQWQQSASGTGNWIDIANESRQTIQLSNPIDGQYFRVTVASSRANLAQNSCRIASNPTRVTYLPERDTLRRTICLGDTFRIANQAFFQAGSTNLTGKAVNGCDSVATVIITMEDLSSFMIAGEHFLCKGDTATLYAGDFAKYNWSNGDTTAELNITTPGIYDITVTSIHNCIGQDTIQVNNSEVTDFQINSVPPLCSYSSDGQIQILDITGDLPPFSFNILGKSLQTEPTFNNLSGGNYTIITQNAMGCTLAKTIALTPPPLFTVELSEMISNLELGDSITLNAVGNYNIIHYLWESTEPLSCQDCPNPIAKPLRSAQVRFTATNADGCIAMDSLQLLVTKVSNLYAPYAFSPNNDGVNDVFQIFTGKGIARLSSVVIFDRWGNMLFNNTNTADFQWDGSFKGKIMPTGVYVWLATVTYLDGSLEQYQGDVTIIR